MTVRLWIALGTGASRELAAFARVAPAAGAPAILCLDTDAPPDPFVDERGAADDRFIALSGFPPRRFAEETLEKDPEGLGWLAKDAFDRLPREYLHESAAKMRVLGRLAYERARDRVRAAIAHTELCAQVGIAVDAGGGMSGALVPVLEDVRAAHPAAPIDVVLALDARRAASSESRAQAYATLLELERFHAEVAPAVARAHLLKRHEDGVVSYSAVLEIVEAIDAREPPTDAEGRIDRESAKGRLFESTRHALELDAEGRAPKLFFLAGTREIAFPVEMLERTLVARYEREVVVEALALDARKTGPEGQGLARAILEDARQAGFAALGIALESEMDAALEKRMKPLLEKSVSPKEAKAGAFEALLGSARSSIQEMAGELLEAGRAKVDAAAEAVRPALRIRPHLFRGISLPAIAEAARQAVEQARSRARALESGSKTAFTEEQLERRFQKLIRPEGQLASVRAAADSMFGAEKKLDVAFEPIAKEMAVLAAGRLRGVIDEVEALFWRRVSTSEIRNVEPSPLEAHARALGRFEQGHVAALLAQLDYTAMRRAGAASSADGVAVRISVPAASTLSEAERLAEFKEIFAPMRAFDELFQIVLVLEKEGATLEEEAASSDPTRFVALFKRTAKGRARRLLAAKIEPRLSLHLGRMKSDARSSLGQALEFAVPFAVKTAVLDPLLDRPEALAVGGAHLPDAPPIEAHELHGWAPLAFDRAVVMRALCAVPLFAIEDVSPLEEAYRSLVKTEPLHPEKAWMEDARRGRWSRSGSKLKSSRALAEEAKARIASAPAPAAHVGGALDAGTGDSRLGAALNPRTAVDAADSAAPSAERGTTARTPSGGPRSLTRPLPAERRPIVLPHPDTIKTFALARALSHAMKDDDAVAASVRASMPLIQERFSTTEAAGLIEMQKIAGEGWHAFASRAVECGGDRFKLGERVALGRYDLAANLLAYAAVPEIVESHRRLIEACTARFESGTLEALSRRLRARVEAQRDERGASMNEAERAIYTSLIAALS